MFLEQTTETWGVEDHSWLGSAHGTDCTRPITLDTSTFTAGTHYPNGYFPSGIALGKITATGKHGPYDNAAGDGREVLDTFLYTSQKAPADNTIDVVAAGYDHGPVREAKLPLPIAGAAPAIAAGKADVAGRIWFV